MLEDVPNPSRTKGIQPTLQLRALSYQIMMLRHVAVKHSDGNKWDPQVWRKRHVNNLGSWRRQTIDNRPRGN